MKNKKNKFNEVKPGHGVSEWAPWSYNIGTGCSSNCAYCYSCGITMDMAKKDGKVFLRSDWPNEQIKPWKVNIDHKVDEWVMFPSMHCISEKYLPYYILTLENILKAGNRVLIVTKARLQSIQAICDRFPQYKEQILFRITIGSMNANVCKFWEPGAPSPQERMEALQYAHQNGFQTSVSAEPMLESYEEAISLYETLSPLLTDTIWFGKMAEIDKRVDMTNPAYAKASAMIKEFQSNKNIRLLYNSLKDRPKVMWKDSVREVVGL
jgi:DNA repair photolyase